MADHFFLSILFHFLSAIETVSHAPDRLDIDRAGWVRLDLLPDVVDMVRDDAAVPIAGLSPDSIIDLLFTEHDSRILRQQIQDLKFHMGKFYLPAAAHNCMMQPVYGQSGKHKAI